MKLNMKMNILKQYLELLSFQFVASYVSEVQNSLIMTTTFELCSRANSTYYDFTVECKQSASMQY